MASAYDQIQMSNGQTRYRKDKQFVKAADVPDNIKEVVTLTNIVDDNGIVIVEDKGDYAEMTPEEKAAADAAKEDDSDSEDDEPTEKKSNEDDDVDPLTEVPSSVDGGPGTPAALPSQPEAEAERVANLAPRLRSKVPQSEPGMGFKRVNGRTVDIFDLKTPHTHVKLVGGHTVPLSAESYNKRSDAEIERRLSKLGYEIVDFNQLEEAEAAGVSSDDGLEDDDEV